MLEPKMSCEESKTNEKDCGLNHVATAILYVTLQERRLSTLLKGILCTMNASTVVETVNINLEDFSETFLTCSTCLYTYDQCTRKPKLLPCSHSVCLSCLEQLAALPQHPGALNEII
ncbi:hypothetical protein DICVIV_10456 [Dictyocaulus viviparus]|uniref:RING-type domain-containing protein n=1 Tax=Dictyocaulus viviparus TaxID=29172 RepID=A0A0D8XIB6_DICVI|nr:hypothetical protein DICVIV_10456 [Dictyocaulus viviparus]